jgi:hypothetical protein
MKPILFRRKFVKGAALTGAVMKNLIVALFFILVAVPSKSQDVIERNSANALHRGVYELTFNTSSAGRDPYYEVKLYVTFVTPDGGHVQTEGFFDGGTLFKGRAYCNQVGPWKWFSTSNDPAMNGISGEFQVIPSNLKGKLVIHPDDPYQFAYDNGDWFLHIGDTGYRYVVASEPYWQKYIDQASEMGVTKIRTWFAMGRNRVGHLFMEDQKTIALYYWKEIERRIIYSLENYPHIILQLIPYAEDAILVNRYSEGDPASLMVPRYAQARWSSFPNVQWTISNDLIIIKDDEQTLTGRQARFNAINRIGKDMSEREPWGTLITNHQSRFQGNDFYNEQWMDITSIHDLDHVHGNKILEYREKKGQPVVLDEDRYEHWRPPVHRRYFFRRLMWGTLLSGGHATYGGLRTYEAYGGDRMGAQIGDYLPDDGEETGVWGYFDANRKGILQQGAHDFRHIHTFFQSSGITLTGMIPEDGLAGNDPLRYKCIQNDDTHIIYLANPSGDEPQNDYAALTVPEATLQLAKGDYHIQWFDPRSGNWVNGGIIKGGSHTLKAPGQEDWVLLVRKTS